MDTVQVPGRAGLAANQIGSSLAVFSYNTCGQLGYVINPEVTEASGSQDGPEACLSIPGVSAIRPRTDYAVVTGVDLRQQPVVVAGTGELARCLQHETGRLPPASARHPVMAPTGYGDHGKGSSTSSVATTP